jgi:hypothetical protein
MENPIHILLHAGRRLQGASMPKRAVFMAAPAFLFLYGIAHFIDGLDGSHGPGLPWTLGHVMFLLALVMFGAIIVLLRERVGSATGTRRFIATMAMVVGLIGSAIFVRVAIIDIITGLRAADNAGMGAISKRLNAYPIPSLVPYYNFGPLLFQFGLLALMLQLAALKPRQLPWWSPVLLLAGFLVLGFDTSLLLPGAILIGIALAPFYVSTASTWPTETTSTP